MAYMQRTVRPRAALRPACVTDGCQQVGDRRARPVRIRGRVAVVRALLRSSAARAARRVAARAPVRQKCEFGCRKCKY